MDISEDFTILVCCHKKDFFCKGKGFLPIQVGKALNNELDLGIQGDDDGDNISEENPNFCELTAHYWYWKNAKKTKYVGLNHYRRYFALNTKLPFGTSFLNVQEAMLKNETLGLNKLPKILKNHDIILAKPIIYPYSLFDDYCHAHIINDLKILQDVIHELSPEYDKSFDQVMHHNNKLSHYNMFITTNEIFEDYSEWLFKILFEVRNRVKISQYQDQARIFGYMSERMLNVYVHHKKLRIKYSPILKVCEDYNYGKFQNFAIAVKHTLSASLFTRKHSWIGRFINRIH